MKDVCISVCIPCYEMSGEGYKYLEHNLNQLLIQDFKKFEVIVSDQSKSNEIKVLCDRYKDSLNLKYYLNTDGKKQASANTNYAMKKASGDIIKILFQDDYLFSKDALTKISNTFKKTKVIWAISGSEHTFDGISVFRKFIPKYNKNIQFGYNTISSPSVLSIRRENYIKFDEELIYLMDVDLYKRYFDRNGLPNVIDEVLVVNRLHDKQVSQLVSKSLIRSELHYIRKKFKSQMDLKNWFIYIKRVLKSYI